MNISVWSGICYLLTKLVSVVLVSVRGMEGTLSYLKQHFVNFLKLPIKLFRNLN